MEIAPIDESAPVPKGARCQEASILSRANYVPCSAPATTIVRHDNDRRSYLMCTPCADHNLRNRGGKFVSSIDEGMSSRYGPLKPCPFCRSTDVKSGTRDGTGYVDCAGCRATVYFHGSRNSPREGWNQRETGESKFVVELLFEGGPSALLPANGESGKPRLFGSINEARRESDLELLRQTLSSYNDDACEFDVDALVGSRIWRLTEA